MVTASCKLPRVFSRFPTDRLFTKKTQICYSDVATSYRTCATHFKHNAVGCKVVNFTRFICFCRSVTTATVATSEFFADLLYKSSATTFGFANDFVLYPAIYPGQVNYVIKYVYWSSYASTFDRILIRHLV